MYPNARLPVIEPAKENVIFPTKDLIIQLMETLSATTRAEYDMFRLVAEAVGAIQYDSPENIRNHSDRVFSQFVDNLGQSDASIIAMAVLTFTTALHQRFKRYNLYINGELPLYFQRMVGHDMVLSRVLEAPYIPQPEKKYHVASLRDRVRRS